MDRFNLREADKVEVTILVDNYTDLLMLQSTEVVKRPGFPPPQAPIAEHGLSCLLKVYAGQEEHLILLDMGISEEALFHNADLLKVDLNQVEAVVLSHGHYDHFGGLLEFLKRAHREVPLHLHPGAYVERRINVPSVGRPSPMPVFDRAVLQEIGAVLCENVGASTICSDLVLVTGEVKRVTEFEKGFPWAEAKIDDQWVVDPFYDDQGVAMNVKGKGLVVLGGCSHAGIINTVKAAQEVSGAEAVYAVLGGFHLTGPIFDPIIGSTITEMKKFNPKYVVPMHCTGWKAINLFAREMPEQFLLNSVGSTYIFQ